MKIKILLLFVSILITSCNSENHYHDGNYEGGIFFINVTWEINGNEILINNSITGTSKLQCKQYPDRIEYEEKDGTTKILYAQENGDLKMSDLVIFKKINSESSNKKEISKEDNSDTSIRNKSENFDLSKDSFDNVPAYLNDIFIVENEIYIVLDIAQIKYVDDVDFEIVNENTKLRTYKISSDVLVRDFDCKEWRTSKYFVENKTKILSEKENFRMVTTNTKGKLTYINFGCWS